MIKCILPLIGFNFKYVIKNKPQLYNYIKWKTIPKKSPNTDDDFISALVRICNIECSKHFLRVIVSLINNKNN